MIKTHRMMFWFLLMSVGLIAGSGDSSSATDATAEAPADASAAATSEDQAPSDEPTSVPSTQPSDRTAPTGANVAIIRIEGLIYGFTLDSLKRRVDRAVAQGASWIVIELDTPGGMVGTALDMTRYIKGEVDVRTTAWINSKAYSAGIMIAAACNEIVMSKSSFTGDCAPIVPGTSLGAEERAKALSPILEEFRASAKQNGYDYPLFHAMCVLGVEVYLIRDPETQERRLVNQVDYQIMVKGATMSEATATSANIVGSATQPSYNVGAPTSELNEVQQDENRGQWEIVEQIHDGRTLLTLSQDRAINIGLARKIVQTESELKEFTGAENVIRIDQSWSEDLAGWLVHPMVRMVLILALLLGAYVEFQTPGLGIAGAVALLALITLMGAPFLVGLAEIWHLVVFFIGFILIMVELFVTPGFGLLGASGLICMLSGLVLAIVPTSGGGPMPLPAPEMLDLLQQSVVYSLIGIVASCIGFYFLTKHLGAIPLVNRLVLHETSGMMPAGLTASGPLTVSGDEVIGRGEIRVGQQGRAVTGLRPSGRAEIDGQVIDVVSQGSWIESGKAVHVVEVHGNRIVVEADG